MIWCLAAFSLALGCPFPTLSSTILTAPTLPLSPPCLHSLRMHALVPDPSSCPSTPLQASLLDPTKIVAEIVHELTFFSPF